MRFISGYKPATKVKSSPKDIKPPDLWIHDMEMKNIKGQNPDTMTVSPIPREDQDGKHMDDSPAGMDLDMDKRRNSFVSKWEGPAYCPYLE